MAKVVLAVVYEAYQFNVFKQLFQQLANKNKDYKFIMYSPYYLPLTEEYLNISKDQGFGYIHNATSNGGDANALEQINRLQLTKSGNSYPKFRPVINSRLIFITKNKIRHFYRKPLVKFKEKIFNYVLTSQFRIFKNHQKTFQNYANLYKNAEQHIRTMLDALNPAIILFTEDVVERDSNIWIKNAHKRNILSLIVSSSTATITEAAETYFDRPEYLFPTNAPGYIQWILKAAYKKWCFNYRGKQFIRLPLNQLIAMDMLDYAPRLPWTINSGDADIILVESKFSRDLQIRDGIKPGKLKIMGSLKFDQISNCNANLKEAKQALYEKYNLCSEKKLVLCAFPPYLPERALVDCKDYDDMIAKWIAALSAPNLNVLYSIHPTGFPVTVNKIRALGQNVVDEELAVLLPHCDVFLASVSSTIKWARACNKLVIDFDCFQFNYTTYDLDPAIIPVKNFNEFVAWVERLSKQSLQDIMADLESPMPHDYWGKTDGLSMQRLYHCIESLMK